MQLEINILAFGQIADITGNTDMKISGVKDTDDLNNKLVELFPLLSSIKYSIAVNKRIVNSNTEFGDKDIVALLPPFSGG